MKLKNTAHFHRGERTRMEASVRPVMLALISFLLGIAVTAAWFHRPANRVPANTVSPSPQDSAVGIPAPPPAPAPPPMANPPPIDPAVIGEVKKAVPNFADISLDDGEKVLQAAAMKDFGTAVQQMNDEVQAARQQLQNAQNSQSAADQQAAMKHVQDAQAAGAEKLKQIAARLQDQIAALKSLKNQK